MKIKKVVNRYVELDNTLKNYFQFFMTAKPAALVFPDFNLNSFINRNDPLCNSKIDFLRGFLRKYHSKKHNKFCNAVINKNTFVFEIFGDTKAHISKTKDGLYKIDYTRNIQRCSLTINKDTYENGHWSDIKKMMSEGVDDKTDGAMVPDLINILKSDIITVIKPLLKGYPYYHDVSGTSSLKFYICDERNLQKFYILNIVIYQTKVSVHLSKNNGPNWYNFTYMPEVYCANNLQDILDTLTRRIEIIKQDDINSKAFNVVK